MRPPVAVTAECKNLKEARTNCGALGGPGGPGSENLKDTRASPGGLGGPMLWPGSAVRNSQGQRP